LKLIKLLFYHKITSHLDDTLAQHGNISVITSQQISNSSKLWSLSLILWKIEDKHR